MSEMLVQIKETVTHTHTHTKFKKSTPSICIKPKKSPNFTRNVRLKIEVHGGNTDRSFTL